MDNLSVPTLEDIVSYLLSVVDGSSSSSNLVSVKDGSDVSFVELFKSPSEKERLKASDLLSKCFDFSSTSHPSLIIDDLSTNFFQSTDLSSSLSLTGGGASVSSNEIVSSMSVDGVGSGSSVGVRRDFVLRYLFSVMLGKSVSSSLVTVKDGSGSSSVELLKSPCEEERLKACELLIKLLVVEVDDVSLPNVLFANREDLL